MAPVTPQQQAYDAMRDEIARLPLECWGDLARISRSLQAQYRSSAQLLAQRASGAQELPRLNALIEVSETAYLGAMVAEGEARSGDFGRGKVAGRFAESLLVGLVPQAFLAAARAMTAQEQAERPGNVHILPVQMATVRQAAIHETFVADMAAAVARFDAAHQASPDFSRHRRSLMLPYTGTLVRLLRFVEPQLTPRTVATIQHVCQQTGLPGCG